MASSSYKAPIQKAKEEAEREVSELQKEMLYAQEWARKEFARNQKEAEQMEPLEPLDDSEELRAQVVRLRAQVKNLTTQVGVLSHGLGKLTELVEKGGKTQKGKKEGKNEKGGKGGKSGPYEGEKGQGKKKRPQRRKGSWKKREELVAAFPVQWNQLKRRRIGRSIRSDSGERV